MSGLEPGMYTVEEIVAPDGYVIDVDPQNFLLCGQFFLPPTDSLFSINFVM